MIDINYFSLDQICQHTTSFLRLTYETSTERLKVFICINVQVDRFAGEKFLNMTTFERKQKIINIFGRSSNCSSIFLKIETLFKKFIRSTGKIRWKSKSTKQSLKLHPFVFAYIEDMHLKEQYQNIATSYWKTMMTNYSFLQWSIIL